MKPTRRKFMGTGAGLALATPSPGLATSVNIDRVSDTAAEPVRIDLSPARWIWLPAGRILPNTFVLFRKEITLDAVPSKALAWITADSRYRLTVNGKRVQWGPAPCDPRTLDVDPADLTAHLRPGRNIIGVEVLFYGQGDGTWPAGKPGLIFHLKIGAAAPIVTDATWRCFLDRAHRPGAPKRWYLRALQEEFDARLHPYGWDTADFAPGPDWMEPAILDCPSDKPASCQSARMWSGDTLDRADPAKCSLRARQIPLNVEQPVAAIRCVETGRVEWLRKPEDWFEFRMPGCFRIHPDPAAHKELPATDGGAYATYELRDQVVGFPYFTIDAPEGTVIELMTQESHDPARTHWLDTHIFSWSRYVCREGTNRFEAFDYESCRWIQLHVHANNRPVRIRDVGVRRKLYAWPRQPAIRCSEPALQRLFDASVNTLYNSAIETAVDGMGRERQQYSGDGGHQMHAIRYAFGETRIARRYLRTFSEGLTPGGYFLDCWPAYDRLARVSQKQIDGAYWGPLLDHGVGFVFDCWNHYFETGEKEALAEPYPRLVRFANYLESQIAADGLLPVENLGIPTVWIDHNAYKQNRHRQCAFNLYVAAMFEHALAPLAALHGDPAHAARARNVSRRIRAAAVRRYWSPKHGLFVDNLPWLNDEKSLRLSDRTLATSILFDQCPKGNTTAAARTLAEAPPELGISYPCNAGWRYWALLKAGRPQPVINDLRERWATMASVRQNNTLQEFWTAAPDTSQQWSHCPLAPLFVAYMDIAGIRPLAPGFSRCQIRPQLGDLPDLELTAFTPRGLIQFRATRQVNGHQISLALPQNCQGELVVPGGSQVPLKPLAEGRYAIPAGSAVEFFAASPAG